MSFHLLSFNYFTRYDLNLPFILDYEIWNASHMLSQTSPYNDLASNKDPQPSLNENHVKSENVVVVM